MKILVRVISLFLMVVAAFFAVANRTSVTVSLAPFPYEVETPLFVVVLAAALLGLMVGGAVTRIGAARRRRSRTAGEAAALYRRDGSDITPLP